MKKKRFLPVLLPVICLALLVCACTEDKDYYGLLPSQGGGAEEVLAELLSGVRVIHTYGGVVSEGNPAGAVDILIDDGLAGIPGLAYGQSSGYAELPPAYRNVKIFLPGGADPVLEGNVDFLLNDDYTAFAVGLPDAYQGDSLRSLGTDVWDSLFGFSDWWAYLYRVDLEGQLESDLFVLVANDNRYALNDAARLRFVHACPDAPPVDIGYLDGEVLVKIFNNVQPADIQGYIKVPPGEYDLAVTLASVADPLVTFETVALEAGQVLTVVALGTIVDDLQPTAVESEEQLEGRQVDGMDAFPFTVRAFVDTDAGNASLDLVPTKPQVRVIHLSNGAPDVDIAVDGTVAIESLAYGESSGYGNIPNGLRQIGVIGAIPDRPVVLEATLPFSLSEEYTIFATYDAEGIVAPVIGVDDRAPAEGAAKLRFLHASPDTGLVNVDVGYFDGEGYVELFSDTNFQELSAYLSPIPPATYGFGVRVGDGDWIALAPEVSLNAGDVITVVAFGLLESADYPFTVRAFVDNDPGTAYLDLSLVLPEGTEAS